MQIDSSLHTSIIALLAALLASALVVIALKGKSAFAAVGWN